MILNKRQEKYINITTFLIDLTLNDWQKKKKKEKETKCFIFVWENRSYARLKEWRRNKKHQRTTIKIDLQLSMREGDFMDNDLEEVVEN